MPSVISFDKEFTVLFPVVRAALEVSLKWLIASGTVRWVLTSAHICRVLQLFLFLVIEGFQHLTCYFLPKLLEKLRLSLSIGAVAG